MAEQSKTDDGSERRSERRDDIRTSIFFESSIITAFLNATLADARFPKAALTHVMQPDDVSGPPSLPTATVQALTPEQRLALADTIRALCTHLALPNVEQSSSEALQRRISLGFCRMLNGQVKEAESDFNLVRRTTLSMMRKSRSQHHEVVGWHSLAVLALWGAEIVAREQGKDSEATRLRTWRRETLTK